MIKLWGKPKASAAGNVPESEVWQKVDTCRAAWWEKAIVQAFEEAGLMCHACLRPGTEAPPDGWTVLEVLTGKRMAARFLLRSELARCMGSICAEQGWLAGDLPAEVCRSQARLSIQTTKENEGVCFCLPQTAKGTYPSGTLCGKRDCAQ